MTLLTDGTEQLAADVVFTGAAIAHDALAGADHRDSHAVKHLGKLIDRAIHSAARLALAVDHVDHLFAIAGIFQPHADLPLARIFNDIVVIDVSLVLEDLRNTNADL